MTYKIIYSILSIVLCLSFTNGLPQASASQDALDINKILSAEEQSEISGILFSASEQEVRVLLEGIRGDSTEGGTESFTFVPLSSLGYDDDEQSQICGTFSPGPEEEVCDLPVVTLLPGQTVEYERLIYKKCFIHYELFMKQAETQCQNPLEATRNFKYAMGVLLSYWRFYSVFNSGDHGEQTMLYVHKMHVMQALRDSCTDALKLHQIDPDLKLIRPILELSIAAADQALHFLNFLQTTHKVKGFSDTNQTTVLTNSLKMSQFSCYVNLADFFPRLRQTSMKQAKTIRRFFCDFRQKKEISICNSLMDSYQEGLRTCQRYKRNGRRKKLPKTQALLYKERQKAALAQKRKIDSMEEDGCISPATPGVKIQRDFLTLSLLDFSDPSEGAECKEVIESIEAQVVSLYKIGCVEDFESIYGHLDNLLSGGKLFNRAPPIIATVFTKGGDVEGALARIEALKRVYLEKSNNISIALRITSAILHNLNGDPSEWLALEAESEQIRAKNRARKKSQRERKRARNVAKRRDALESKGKADVRESSIQTAEVQEEKSSAPVSQRRGSTRDTGESPHYDPPRPSREEERAAKLERHRQAEARREEKRLAEGKSDLSPQMTVRAVASSSPRALTEAEELEATNSSSTETMVQLFKLTGTALKVDREIERGTWKITREQLKIYFEALGCVYKLGKGSHKKISLPKCTHIYQGDELISIMSEFGGALTLPNWEKRYLPLYLRKQITMARLKLRALKIRKKRSTSR